MERSRVLGRWAAGSVALALALSACGGGSSGGGGNSGGSGGSSGSSSGASTGAATSGKQGGAVSINLSEPQYLYPAGVNETNGSEVLDALFTGLIRYDEKNQPQLTELAQSITSSDNKTWDIKINSGWKFSDGTAVTSDSFINAWNYCAYGPNGENNAYFFGPDGIGIQGYNDLQAAKPGAKTKAKTMSGLKKVSDTEFKVTLDQPSNFFEAALGYTAFYPLPQAFFTQGKQKFQQQPIGDGPFKMKGSWVHNQYIDVVQNPDYGGKTKPHVAEIDYKMYKAQETAYNDLISGNLDVLNGIPSTDLAQAKSNLGNRYVQFPSSNYGFLGFPTFDPSYKDINVRKAISESIDRPTIMKTVFQGTRVPADDFVAPVLPGYQPGACGELCTYNPTKAKQYWSQASSKPSTITLTYNADGGHKPWIDAACNMIQQNLGVQCVGKAAPDFATLLNNLDKAKKTKASFGAFRLGWIMDYPSMQDYLGPLYSTNGSSNYYGYSNKQFDALVAKGSTEKSQSAAIADWQKAVAILAKDAPVAPIYFGADQVGFSTKVTGVRVDAYDHIDKLSLSLK